MQANPEKFQAIAVGKKMHDDNVVFDLNGISLSCDEEVNYWVLLLILNLTLIHIQ